MGTTSEKLTYLNTTKGKIKDSINLTGANILSTDTFRSYATKLKNGLVDIINNGIDTLYDNFPKVTAEGTEIVLNNTYEAPLKLNVVKGDTQQDSTLGTNYFNANAIDNSNIVVTDDGKTITMPIVSSGNGITSTNKKLSELCPTLKVGDVIYLKFTRNLSTNYNKFIYLGSPASYLWNVNSSITITQDHLNSDVSLYANRYQNGETDQVILTDFRMVKNTNDEWEKFTYGASPNPDYPQNVNVVTGLQNVSISDGTNTTNYEVNLGNIELCKIGDYQDTLQKSSGKNQIGLQDLSSTTTNAITYSISNGVLSINGTASAKTIIQNVLFNLTQNTSKRLKIYLDSGTFTSGAFGISLRDSNNNQISFIQMAYNIEDLDTTKTISLTGVDHIELYVTSGATFGNAKFRLILVDSGESYSYEPYGKVWYKKSMIGKYVYNDDLTPNGYNDNQVNMLTPALNALPSIASVNFPIYCNIMTTYVGSYTKIEGTTSASKIRVNIGTSYASDYTEARTIYSNKNLTIYYQLATPTYTEITNTSLINQLESIKSKEDSTYITISGNLPMIINASALEKE